MDRGWPAATSMGMAGVTCIFAAWTGQTSFIAIWGIGNLKMSPKPPAWLAPTSTRPERSLRTLTATVIWICSSVLSAAACTSSWTTAKDISPKPPTRAWTQTGPAHRWPWPTLTAMALWICIWPIIAPSHCGISLTPNSRFASKMASRWSIRLMAGPWPTRI